MTNDDLSRELSRARELLRRAGRPRGARQRVLLRVLAHDGRQRWGRALRLCVAVGLVAVTISGSAIGFSLVLPRILTGLRNIVAPASSDAVNPEGPALTGRRRGPQDGPAVPPLENPVEEQTPDRGEVSSDPSEAAPSERLELHRASRGQSTRTASEAATAGGPSELSLQVAAYREAVSDLGRRPDRALSSLRAFRTRWPRSALTHEVDLRIVQALVSLDRRAEAQAEARAFLTHYPDSVHRADMEALTGP